MGGAPAALHDDRLHPDLRGPCPDALGGDPVRSLLLLGPAPLDLLPERADPIGQQPGRQRPAPLKGLHAEDIHPDGAVPCRAGRLRDRRDDPRRDDGLLPVRADGSDPPPAADRLPDLPPRGRDGLLALIDMREVPGRQVRPPVLHPAPDVRLAGDLPDGYPQREPAVAPLPQSPHRPPQRAPGGPPRPRPGGLRRPCRIGGDHACGIRQRRPVPPPNREILRGSGVT